MNADNKLQKIKNIISKIRIIDEDTQLEHSEDVDGFSGGNIDDAYQLGYDDGYSSLAEYILSVLEDE
jgi:hypothetical protein